MKKFLKSLLLGILITLFISSPVLAAYYALIQVYTTTTAYTMLPVIEDMDNDLLVTNNYIDADGLDTRVTRSGAAVPHLLTTEKTLFASSLPAASTNNFYYTTDNVALTAFNILTGYGGWLITDDAAALEPGADFEQEYSVYVPFDSSNFTFLGQKRDAVAVAVTDTDELSGIIYFEEPVDVSPVATAAWTDIDVSDYVPSYATGAVVHLVSTVGIESIGVRINGSAQDFQGDVATHIWTMVGVDASFIFEGYIETATDYIYLVGFTGSGVNYKTVADDISLAGALAWTDIDLSVEAPDAVGVIVAVDNTAAGNDAYGLRKNGSVDNRVDGISGNGWYYGIIGCDAAQIIEGYVGALTTDFYLVGYITADFTFETDATDKSPAAGFAAWTDMDCSGDVPVGTTHIIFEVDTSANVRNYGLRRNGGTEDIHTDLYYHCWAVVECDSDYIVEYYAEDANVDFYIVGYTQGYIDSPYDDAVLATGLTAGEQVVNHSLNANAYDFSDYDTYTTVAVNMGGGMMPVVLLDEEELAAPAASVTFSNIDTLVSDWDAIAGVTSRHLVLIVNAASADVITQRDVWLRFNGDSAANYNIQRLYGSAAGAAASINTAFTDILCSYIPGGTYANAYGGGVTLIPHAFNTTNHKSTISISGSAENTVGISTGRWESVASITSISLRAGLGNFATGSTFWLGVVDERYLIEEDLLAAPGTIDINNIPQDGSDFCAIGYLRGTNAAVEDELVLELNADGVAANYFTQRLLGTAAVTSAATANDNLIGWIPGDNATANAFGAFVGFVNQYAETTNDPHYLTLNGYHETVGPTSRVGVYSGRWNNVVAVDQLEFYGNGAANLATGTLFSSYRVPRTVIDRQELTAPAATITFTDIPQGYEALQLNIYARSSVAAISDDIFIEINADAVAANYDHQELYGAGAVVGAGRSAASNNLMTISGNTEGANEFNGGIITIPNYAKADRHKHLVNMVGRCENAVLLKSIRWEDTSPITQVVLTLGGVDNFMAGTIVELVGIFPQDVHAIEVDGDLYGISDGNNLSVPDVTMDYNYMLKNCVPYMDYYTLTISGTATILYQPNDIIVDAGTTGTLPDRQGAAQDGTIIWGTNPADITTAIGSLISTDVTIPITDDISQDIIPETPVISLFGMTAPTNMFSPLFDTYATIMNVPSIILWVAVSMIFIVGGTIAFYYITRNGLYAGFMGSFLIIICATAGTIPRWAIILAVMLTIFSAVQHSRNVA